MVTFTDMPLSQPVLAALAEMGYTEPSPIQAAAIPIVLEGKDVVGKAQTGTGKTLAFGIPLIMAAAEGRGGIVLVPTRELAAQVTAELTRAGKHSDVLPLALVGGAPFGPQARALETGRHAILVATPGRLRDHLKRGTFDAGAAGMLVLDEADEMLDMGFLEEVEEILQALHKDRQTLLFSATMAEPIVRLAERYMRDPEHIHVESSRRTVAAENTTQFVVRVDVRERLDALIRILAVERPTGTLVFRHTRDSVDALTAELRQKGIPAEALHGGMAQPVRDAVLARLRSGRTRVMVATNVAARGLDVDALSHVVNYDAPRETDAYVHRIGRTGRAGRDGRAFLFVTPSDQGRLRGIERTVRIRLEEYEVPTDAQVHAAVAESLGSWLDERPAPQPERLKRELAVVEDAVENGKDLRLMAAALLADLAKHEGLEAPPLEARRNRAPQAFRGDDRRGGDRGDFRHDARHDRRPPMTGRPSTAGRVSIAINVGREDRVRPGDLVGALTNEGGLVGADIGRIDILPRMSVVEVPSDSLDRLGERMAQSTIRGRPFGMRLAADWKFRAASR